MRRVYALLAAVALAALALAGCSSGEQSPPPQPPPVGQPTTSQDQPPAPPAAFGQPSPWANGGSVVVEPPRVVNAPTVNPKGGLILLGVKVTNGTDQPIPATSYVVDITSNGTPVSAAALGVVNLPNGAVAPRTTATLQYAFEAPPEGAKLRVTVSGADDDARPATVFEGLAPRPAR